MEENADFDFVLSRVNVPHRVILDRRTYSHTCGRNRHNEIVCVSILVSREHCLFVRVNNEVFVMDLKSSNGTFVNGKSQPSNDMIKLKEGDLIGIGCATLNPTDDTMFVYELQKCKPVDSPQNKAQSILAETTISHSNQTLNVSDSEKTAESVCKRRTTRSNGDATVPCKMRKLDDNIVSSTPEKRTVKGGSDNVTKKCVAKTMQVSDSTANPMDTKKSPVSKQTEKILIDNASGDNAGTKLIPDAHELNGSPNVSSDERKKSKMVRKKNLGEKSQKEQTGNVRNTINNGNDDKVKKLKNTDGSEEIRRISRDKPSSNTLAKNNEKRCLPNEESAISNSNVNTRRRGRTNDENVKRKMQSTIDSKTSTLSPIVSLVKCDNLQFPKNVPETNVCLVSNGYQLIKLEEELQITDEEDIMENVDMVDPLATSPLKLKKIDQEPITRFSAVDVVTLSDDDDNLFPCSQLFDDTCNVTANVKTEVKQELIENENDSFNGLYDEIVILSDSDDEDNVWLEKLSRSQVYNSTLEMDSSIIPEAQESTERDVYRAKKGKTTDESYNSTKVENNTEVHTKTATESLQAINTDTMNRSNAQRIDSMDVDAFEEENANKSTKAASTRSSRDVSLEARVADTSIDKSEKSSTTVKKKAPQTRKPLPIIEAPFFYPKSRSSVSIGSNTSESSRTEKSELKPPTKKKKKTREEEKEEKRKKKIEHSLYEQEQKNRKTLYKWANCVPSKGGRKSSLSKEEKTEIIKERKEKLKKISNDGKKTNVEDAPVKRAPAKVKVSRKTRFDCLAEDIGQVSAKPDKDKNDVNTKDAQASTKGQANRTESAVDMVTKNLRSSLCIDNSKSNGEVVAKIDKVDGPTVNSEARRKNKVAEKASATSEKLQPISAEDANKLKIYTARKVVSSLKPKKKRVTFSDHNKIFIYEIDPNNKLTRLVGKDAPIPGEKLPTVNLNNAIAKSCPTLREFLLRIFSWNPVWLEEQVRLQSLPPVVKQEELIPMLTSYKSFSDYYKIVLPLLLLEIWSGITKEFFALEKHKSRPTVMCSIVMNSVNENQQPGSNVRVTTMLLEAVVTKEDYQRECHPRYGDLVYFEYVVRNDGKCTFHKVFAYVQDVYKTIISSSTHYNKELNNYTKAPYALLTFTMMTRPIKGDVIVNRVQRLRTVTYLRANLRMVQALQYLPLSPLVNAILQPKAEAYQLPTLKEIKNTSLVTKDQLNEKQLEAVLTVTEAVIRKREPRICLIQGPPGTGKSKVIVNIITQILYGDDRYKSNMGPLRILVCAPSNAAIDEILLRLLAIRSNFENRFKMVRIGRPETMHPTARDISVTELAKRDVKRTTSTYAANTAPSDSIQEEKVLLQAKINALKCELTSCQRVDEAYQNHIRMKIDDMTSKYEMLDKRKPLHEMSAREIAKIHRGTENKILERADIITCTLSSCYTNQMESIFGGNKERISVCIVDEATQSCEAETLIPLMLGVNTLVLVGDPNQLPATIISQDAKKLGLDQSLFSRVQQALENQKNNPIIMLEKQYRMAYPISYWPNKFFYGGKLKNAVETKYELPFQYYKVLNLDANQNKDRFSNTHEAEFIANMVYTIMHYTTLKSLEHPIRIGILTPYNNQRTLVISKINERISSIPEDVRKKIITEVNTVDSFQGQERDVIIMSCVRSHGIGFLSDRQRLCVALTRAKHSLIMCGNFKTFMRDHMWSELLRDAKSRGVYCNIDAKAEPSEIKKHIIR